MKILSPQMGATRLVNERLPEMRARLDSGMVPRLSATSTPREFVSTPSSERDYDQRYPRLLGARLALFGKVATVVNTLFFVGFQVLWSGEPSVGAAGAWRATLSVGSVLTAAGYAGLWIAAAARPWGRRALRLIELVAVVTLGIGFAGITLTHPVPAISVWEMGLALTVVLALRALLVPSSARWTLAMGSLMSLPSAVTIMAWPAHFGSSLSPKIIAMQVVNRCVVAIAFSTVASSTLYGLRRQVREARRLGQYTLESRLGQGGMGVVYRASHAMLKRPTAIKLLRGGVTASLERFESEVQMMASLRHPNAVAVHDYGRTEDGVFYYAMEYLDGLDLQQLSEMEGPLPSGRVIHLLRQVCGALGEAHAGGLLHRDVKPANIFVCHALTIADLVKVLDFGLVKDLRVVQGADMTIAGALLGTPHYLAPECINQATPPDARSDLYSLGAVAYRLLAGGPVFEGRTSLEVCAHHLHTAPPLLHERTERPVPPDLEAVVMRCLHKDPAARFASAAELAGALDGCADAQTWTDAQAQRWWIDAKGRVDAWRSEHLAGLSSGPDSVIVKPAHRRPRRSTARPT